MFFVWGLCLGGFAHLKGHGSEIEIQQTLSFKQSPDTNAIFLNAISWQNGYTYNLTHGKTCGATTVVSNQDNILMQR
jgi:hypothetical protein